MELGKYYYNQLHDIFVIPVAPYTGDYYKIIKIKLNEFGYCSIEGTVANYKSQNFVEIPKTEFFEKTKIAIDFITKNLFD